MAASKGEFSVYTGSDLDQPAAGVCDKSGQVTSSLADPNFDKSMYMILNTAIVAMARSARGHIMMSVSYEYLS